MSRCNVDFFDTKLNYIYHDSVETPGIDMDYLTPETSSFDVSQTNLIGVRSLVRVEDQDNYLAVVDSVNPGEGKTTISVKPFLSLLDQPMLFDTNWQYKSDGDNTNAKSLEQTIAGMIQQYWIDASDSLQNIPLELYTTSTTTNWSFGLVGDKADDENATSANNHFCIVEFYDAILQNALTRYRVAVETQLDIASKVIKLYIGVTNQTKYIEADLPEVDIIEFTIGKLESDTNKLEIWNDENYTDKIYYYLHNDGTYDTDGTRDRITPIKMEVISTAPEKDGEGTVTKSFADVCQEQADQKFGDIQWRNYIELDVGAENLFNANNMRIGQLAQIVHNGQTYETILTGKKLGYVTTLIFGTIRVDLTKKLQLEASVEYTTAKSVVKNSSTSSS